MTPESWLAGKIKEKGVMQKRIVEKADVPGLTRQKLSASLTGKRRMKAEEFLGVCDAAGVNPLEYPVHEGESRA